MSSSGGSFGGDWQDEGVFFTLVVQTGVAAVFLALFAGMNYIDSTSKVLRPARPDSKWPRFFTRPDTWALFEPDENEVAMRVSVFSALQMLILKYRAHIFMGGFITASCLCVVFATDIFISSYAFRHDSYDCRGRSGKSDCKQSGVCLWNGTDCGPMQLHGLQDLTLLNVTPTHFRSWLIGIFTVAFHIWFAFCAIKMMVEMRVLVFSSKTMPVQLQSEKLALVAKPGSRSVRVSGISEAQCRTFDGTAASLFMKQIKIQNAKYIKEEERSKTFFSLDAPDVATKLIGRGPNIPPRDQLAMIEKLLTKKARETIVVYEPPETDDHVPDSLSKLIIDENEALDVLRDYAARKKKQEEEIAEKIANGEENPSSCCGWCLDIDEGDIKKAEEKLMEIQEKIKSLQNTTPGARIYEKSSQTTPVSSPTQSSPPEDVSFGNSLLLPAGTPTGAAATTNSPTNSKSSKINPLNEMYFPWKVKEHTVAIITFDTSGSAHRFVDLLPRYLKNYTSMAEAEAELQEEEEEKHDKEINHEDHKAKNSFKAAITGPASHIIYPDLGSHSVFSLCQTTFLVATYIIFVFFGSLIIAFFGSIESLASIPGLGDVFGKVVDALPPALFKILQAYLPVIAAAIFQMLIPPLMRSIASSFRLGNWEMREASTFKFMFGYVFMTGVILQTALQGGIFQLAGLIENPGVTDVMNFLVAIFSPKGGYFFALVASSAVFSMLMQTLGIGFVIENYTLAPREALEEKRLENQKPRIIPFDIPSALWMLMFSLGVLFHSTSPLLLMFVCCYFISAYYTFRTLVLDVSHRDPKKNVNVDPSLSSAHATSQVKVMLLLHTLACVGTFIVFILKFLWGAAALASVSFVLNFYMWYVKWNVLDTMLNTTDLNMIEHYDHLLSRRSRTKEEEEQEKKKMPEETTTTTEKPGFLPPFVRTYKFNEYKSGDAERQETLIIGGIEQATAEEVVSAVAAQHHGFDA